MIGWAEEDRGHETPCRIWQGRVAPNGYGTRGCRLAHRIAYEDAKGLIPAGLDIDHLCRQRSCVNPDHLEAVTRSENLRRGAGAKLTAENVREIRDRRNSPTELAERFGVGLRYVHDLRYKDKKWRDIPNPARVGKQAEAAKK